MRGTICDFGYRIADGLFRSWVRIITICCGCNICYYIWKYG